MKFPALPPIDLKNNIGSIEVVNLNIKEVHPDPNQPRKNFDKISLDSLSESIKECGVISPILVRKKTTGGYEIIAGERRWRASIIALQENIPAIIKEADDKFNSIVSLIENTQREDLNPIEIATFLKTLIQDHELSHEDASTLIGKSRSTVSNFIRLLNLDIEAQKLIHLGLIDMGHARAILSLPKEDQLSLAEEIVKKGLSVRSAESLAKKKAQAKKEGKEPFLKERRELEHLLSEVFEKATVSINSQGRGRVTIKFSSLEECAPLVDFLRKREKVNY